MKVVQDARGIFMADAPDIEELAMKSARGNNGVVNESLVMELFDIAVVKIGEEYKQRQAVSSRGQEAISASRTLAMYELRQCIRRSGHGGECRPNNVLLLCLPRQFA